MSDYRSSPQPPESSRSRDRSRTEAALKAALAELVATGKKPSVTAVAAMVGVTGPLVHNTYPDIAKAIRELSAPGASVLAGLDASKALERANRELQRENRLLNAEVAKLASINQALVGEIARLKGQSTSTVVSLLAKRSSAPEKS